MPTPKSCKGGGMDGAGGGYKGWGGQMGSGHSPCGEIRERSTRGSVSNENNILLDPEVLTDYPTQALLLTVLVGVTVIKLLLPCSMLIDLSVNLTHG